MENVYFFVIFSLLKVNKINQYERKVCLETNNILVTLWILVVKFTLNFDKRIG